MRGPVVMAPSIHEGCAREGCAAWQARRPGVSLRSPRGVDRSGRLVSALPRIACNALRDVLSMSQGPTAPLGTAPSAVPPSAVPPSAGFEPAHTAPGASRLLRHEGLIDGHVEPVGARRRSFFDSHAAEPPTVRSVRCAAWASGSAARRCRGSSGSSPYASAAFHAHAGRPSEHVRGSEDVELRVRRLTSWRDADRQLGGT